MLEKFVPAWFNVNPHLALIYGQTIDSHHRKTYEEQKVILKAHDGNLSLRVVNRKKDHKSGKKPCVIIMHGMSSDSDNAYMVEAAGACTQAGYDVILFNHYGVPGEKNLRLVNFTE